MLRMFMLEVYFDGVQCASDTPRSCCTCGCLHVGVLAGPCTRDSNYAQYPSYTVCALVSVLGQVLWCRLYHATGLGNMYAAYAHMSTHQQTRGLTYTVQQHVATLIT